MKEEYKQLRKQSILDTKEKRKSQICKVYELKFDKSHLSKEKINYLNKLFLEAKWLYNNILGNENIFNYNTKIKEVEIINKEKEKELREIKYLSAQMKQGILERIKCSIKALSTKKKKSKKKEVGRLKFKSQINSIPLKQFNVTYKIENEKYIKLQGFKKHFKVLGLKQILENTDFVNATLIRKYGNYYLKVTCFLPKEEKIKTDNNIGLDFGIKDSVITSEGKKFFFNFPETKYLKRTSRRMNKKKKGSNNRYKQKLKLQKQYEKLSNKKKDTRNKFVSKLIKENDLVAIQDEMIHQWAKSKMKGFGRRVQHNIMGGIISDLKKKSETIIISRNFPSTQLCPICGALNKHGLEKREYKCACGYSADRDTHSAKNILNEALKQIGMEHINTMPMEKMLDFSDSLRIGKAIFNEVGSQNF